ncbi:MAG: oligopeptide transport system substrate-binding protein [Candidatus Azotimanducaceae bacterium]
MVHRFGAKRPFDPRSLAALNSPGIPYTVGAIELYKKRGTLGILRVLLVSILLFLPTLYAQAKGVDAEGKKITLALQSEPPSLDSSLSNDTTSSLILALTNEGLVSLDRRGKIIPGMAERWEQDGLDVTFHLREALWSDGSPVTAHDFEYAFKRLVDPTTGAGGSTFFAYILENAEAILQGEKAVETLGAEAVDDRTLKIRLSRPAPYYLSILSGSVWRPLRQDFVEAQDGRYGADAENLLSNGPFVMTDWVNSSSLELKRNPTYWDTANVHLNEIDFGYITSDTRSLLNLYKSGDLAAIRLNEEILKDALNSGMRVQRAPTNCLSWIMMNMRPERPTSHIKVRQAIRYALDRDRYGNVIVGLPGTRVVSSIFTSRMQAVNGSFQEEFPAPEIEYNLQKGRALIAEAKAEMGIEKLPPIVMLINETRQIEAEFVQSQLMNGLGLDVRVDKQTFKQSLVKFRNGEFDIARSGFCGGTLLDPVFFAGIFTSNSPYNDMAFHHDRYNELMNITHYSADQSVRMQAFDEMQHILYDEVPIIPTIESSWVYVQNRALKGMLRYPTVDFSHARIIGPTP